MPISWRDAMAIGDPKVDDDHKKLVNLINAAETLAAQAQFAAMPALLQKLVGYCQDHFPREEEMMAGLNYLDIEAHKGQHVQFSRKLQLIVDKYATLKSEGEQKQCCTILINFMNDHFVNHILKEDLKLKPFVRKPAAALGVSLLSDVAKQSDEDLAKRRAQRNRDVEYQLPPYLSHLLQRLEYFVPELPPPSSDYTSFDKLCEAAICRRIDKVLVFFHRSNPEVVRELPIFFLGSPEFAAKFREAVSKLVFPVIWESRQVRMMSTSFDWTGVDDENFWDHLKPILKETILNAWAEGWDQLKLVENRKEDGTKVLQVKEQTKLLRSILQPSDPSVYDLPKIANREIETFKSLLDTATDWWAKLNSAWQIVTDIYEQEKDPRVFQQKAREGALRDNLLEVFNRFPEIWGDFLVLACHRIFPRISTTFLESFTTNFGRNEKEREAYVPYTMRYLEQVRAHPEIRTRERKEEEQWQEQMKQLRNYLSGRTPADQPPGAKPG
ncbi:MAG TPA: hemerythrin family protein [Rhodospirillaceae bacterium]|nr:hemerythrin family protein [Rhodospirillaceae bacterium]